LVRADEAPARLMLATDGPEVTVMENVCSKELPAASVARTRISYVPAAKLLLPALRSVPAMMNLPLLVSLAPATSE